jgi:NarL family two-component system sensor histidine kinase LiaS
MARKLLSRLQGLMTAANQWSQGNFAFIVQDEADDEFGALAQQLNSMARRLEVLFALQQQHSAAEERQRLARDLHDCIKQEFYALGAQIQIANEVYLQPQRVQKHLQEATLLLQNIQEEMNNLIQHLRPAVLAEKGLKNALQDYAQSWSRLCGIYTHFIHDPQSDGDGVPLEQEQGEAFFRVMQEALSNIARHSCAQYVEVRFFSCSQETVLSITDHGRGFDHERVESGIGIYSMQERFHALGGAVEVSSAPGQGCTVVASLKHVGNMNHRSADQPSFVMEHAAISHNYGSKAS